MPTIGSVTKTIRIAPRDLEVINALMADGTSWSGAIHKLCEGVPTKNPEKSEASPNEDLKEIESMAEFWGITAKELLKGVCSGLMDGNLTYEKGMVVGVPEINMDELEEICHERGIKPQEAIDKLVLTMRKGK